MNNAILMRQEGAVRILCNHHPAKRNAITPALYAELPTALALAQADDAVGAIVLTGSGDFFCSGGDLGQLALRRAMAPAQRRERLEGLHDLIRAIRDCNKPVIAAVEGGAVGAGMSIMLACDLLVVAKNARFSVAYAKVGLTPDGGVTAFLAQFVSRQILNELCLTGDAITGERLQELGAVNRLVEQGAALDAAIVLASRIAAGPERANARIKVLCRKAFSADMDAQMELEAQFMVASQGDDEASEGIGAFLTKRQANFGALRGRPSTP
jgi:enoyl-CoA hydratase/carnithine racemase